MRADVARAKADRRGLARRASEPSLPTPPQREEGSGLPRQSSPATKRSFSRPIQTSIQSSGVRGSSRSVNLDRVAEFPSEEGLVFMRDKDGAVVVRGGTLDALVRKLVTADKGFVDTFLMTFRSFTSAAGLFDALAGVFGQNIGQGADMERTRLKILAIFKIWVDKFYHDWEESPSLLERYTSWLNHQVAPVHDKASVQLLDAARRRSTRSLIAPMGSHSQFDEPAPKPMVPVFGIGCLTDIDDVELARQICLVESRLFRAITPKEFLGKAWEGRDKEEVAPNLCAFIAHFNRVGALVATTVLGAAEENRRVMAIEYWSRVAQKLFELSNFNALMEIVGGLGSCAVARLSRTWANVSRKERQGWEKLCAIMSPQRSFASYRAAIRSAQPPLVPYLGIFMQDMVFIEDGNPDSLKGHPAEYINFHKRRLMAEIIQEIQQHQQASYNFVQVDEVVEFVDQHAVEPESVLYQKSLELEPRGQE